MRNTSSQRRVRRSRGSSVVETALCGLIFFCMLLGAFDFGQFLFIHQALVVRARTAARWGAINDPTNSTGITNMVLYNKSSRPDDASAYFNLSSSNVIVSNADSGTNDHRLNVQISGYTYKMFSPYIAGSYTGPLILVSVPLGPYN